MGYEQWAGGAMFLIGICWAVGVTFGMDHWAPKISTPTFTLCNATWWLFATWLLVGAPR